MQTPKDLTFVSARTFFDAFAGGRRFWKPLFIALTALALPYFAYADTFTYDDLGRLIEAEYDSGTIVTYTYDAAGNRQTMHVEIPVPPVANADTYEVIRGIARTLTPLDNDTDENGDVLSILSATSPSNGAAVVQSGLTILYTPNGDTSTGYIGADSFQYTITDNTTQPNVTGNISINVVDNTAPLASGPTLNDIKMGSYVTIRIEDVATDVNVWQNLEFTNLSAPANGTASLIENNTVIAYNSDRPYSGVDSFTFDVIDQHGGADAGNTTTINVIEPTAYVPTYSGSGFSILPIWN